MIKSKKTEKTENETQQPTDPYSIENQKLTYRV